MSGRRLETHIWAADWSNVTLGYMYALPSVEPVNTNTNKTNGKLWPSPLPEITFAVKSKQLYTHTQTQSSQQTYIARHVV